MDPNTGRYNVIVAGGFVVGGNGPPNLASGAWLWDPLTGNIQIRF